MKVKFYTQSDVAEESRKTTKDVISFMLHMFAWYLRDELNWGHDRIDRCLKWLDKHSADYMGADGEVSLTDLHKMLIDEVGIKIDFDKERMR